MWLVSVLVIDMKRLSITLILLFFAFAAQLHASTLPHADLVVVDKSDRKLFLIRGDEPFRSYPIALGANPEGHKAREGDERTPEGRYWLDWRNENSRFYKSIHVSYPNRYDLQAAHSRGHSPGGMIMIHGQPNRVSPEDFDLFLSGRDWTDGCIAVDNAVMDEIWQAVSNGTPIEIRP